MLGRYSEILDLAQIAVVTFPEARMSYDHNSTLYFNISRLANQHLCSSQSEIAGAVLIHGTNTLEETLFGVDLTVNCSKPVVGTGGLRPESYISHDSPSNLYQVSPPLTDFVRRLY